MQPIRFQIGEHFGEVAPDVVRQHEPVVELGTPADELPIDRALPEAGDERADEELLGETHPRIGRHLEAAELDETETSGRTVGREELVDAYLGTVGVASDVDEEIAEGAVDEPRDRSFAGRGGDLGEGDLEFVEAVVAGF